MRVFEKPRIFGLAVREGTKSVFRAMRTGLTSLSGFSAFIPDHLTAAPIDLRTSDPTMAQELYKGIYALGGRVVETGGKNPFSVPSPGGAWHQRLHEFSWIRHLSAEKSVLSSNFARSLIKDWIDLNGGVASELAWKTDITARRLMAWLCNSPTILTGAEHDFHQQFMRSLGVHARFLKRHAGNEPNGMPKLIARIALAYAAICMTGQKRSLRNAHLDLAHELNEQVSRDGCHQSRNPAASVELLTLLLPLKETYISVGIEPPEELVSAIDRLFFSLRVFRLGDGSLVRFNGSGVVNRDLVATLLRYDDAHAGEPFEASCGGFERFVAGTSILVMDAGDVPKGELSVNAHAGCLSFEFSAADECLIINCGTPPPEHHLENQVWRSTAAHSTATINDKSFCKFQGESGFERLLGGQIFSGSLQVSCERDQNKITASHQGYAREFGIVHKRSLVLSDSGTNLTGMDEFIARAEVNAYGLASNKVTVRFHLGPDVTALAKPEENSVLLTTRKDQKWVFTCAQTSPAIEDSMAFATISGMRRTKQIVLYLEAEETPSISWELKCI